MTPATASPAMVGRLNPDADVTVTADGFLTWAALDRTTGELTSHGEQRNTTESMIKPWIVADYLRGLEESGATPGEAELAAAQAAIRHSDDEAAERLYVAGGRDDVVQRLIEMCSLTDTVIVPHWWSRTEMTATDAVRMGECLADGTAAGPEWTGWVLDQMRRVEGGPAEDDQRPEDGFEGGRWGIVDGVPESVDTDQISLKNGWTRLGETDSWHVNCLALTQEWVIAVIMRYPASYSLAYGADRCADVAAQLLEASAGTG